MRTAEHFMNAVRGVGHEYDGLWRAVVRGHPLIDARICEADGVLQQCDQPPLAGPV
jgi:hypothetical protein